MKKIIPIVAILGSVAAVAVYKIKKDEKKKIIDLDEGMLHDEDITEDNEDTVEEEPISEPQSCCVDREDGDVENNADRATQAVDEDADKVEDLAKKLSWETKDAAKDAKEVFPNLRESEIQELKNNTKELMEKMEKEGDVHEQERPVQHTIRFPSLADAEGFKNIVINRGFVVSTGENELELVVLHITPLDEVKLIANILYIVNEAHKHHGKYQGWSSRIAN